MPSNISRFEIVMYVAIALGVLVSAIQFPALAAQAGAGFVIAVQAVVFIVFILLIWLIARKRQNWARWTYLVLFVIGVPFYFPQLYAMLQTSLVAGALSGIQFVLQVYGLFLVFTGDAKDWFKKAPAGPA